eukprot:2464563-Rhodomonas_salina.1
MSGTDIGHAVARSHATKRIWLREGIVQMAAGASAVDSSRVKRGLRLAVLTVALVQNMLCAPANADVTGDQPREVPVIINNKPLRYGNYCGPGTLCRLSPRCPVPTQRVAVPGPAEVNPTQGCRMLPSLPAADFVDEGCLLHDQAYCNCRKTLESKGKSRKAHRASYAVPLLCIARSCSSSTSYAMMSPYSNMHRHIIERVATRPAAHNLRRRTPT